MKNDYYDDFLTGYAHSWMPSNIHHDEYCAEKKQQESQKKDKASKVKKEKKPSRLGRFFHSIIFESILHAKYGDYVDWYVNHSGTESSFYSQAMWVRFFSIIFIPAGFAIAYSLCGVCENLYNIYGTAVFPLLTLVIIGVYIAIAVGLWKAATIELKIISEAKSKAKAIRFEQLKQQYKENY